MKDSAFICTYHTLERKKLHFSNFFIGQLQKPATLIVSAFSKDINGAENGKGGIT